MVLKIFVLMSQVIWLEAVLDLRTFDDSSNLNSKVNSCKMNYPYQEF